MVAITIVKCFRVADVEFGEWTHIGKVKTCFMDVQTTIDEKGYSINERPANKTFGLLMNYNKNIIYLPEDITEVFLHLEAYAAAHCAIEEIYKENFDGLNELKFLNLAGNKISEISSNTFRSLVSLERLSLANNQISSVSGNLLLPAIHTLAQVWLNTNECIDENFTDEAAIGRLLMTLDDNCNGVNRGEVKTIINELMKKVETMVDLKMENLMKQIKSELKSLNKVDNDRKQPSTTATSTPPPQQTTTQASLV